MSRVAARRRRTPRLAGHICPRCSAAVLPPNGSRLSCGALKKDSFLNLRAPSASSACSAASNQSDSNGRFPGAQRTSHEKEHWSQKDVCSGGAKCNQANDPWSQLALAPRAQVQTCEKERREIEHDRLNKSAHERPGPK